MEKKKQENKMRRDQLNDEYLELLDKQRLYFKTVKDFKEVRTTIKVSACASLVMHEETYFRIFFNILINLMLSTLVDLVDKILYNNFLHNNMSLQHSNKL